MTIDALQPTRLPRPSSVPGFEGEEMQFLRTLSREGRMNELGYKLAALAAHGSLLLRDMATATERTEAEVMQIIDEFRAHEALCKRNATQDRLRRCAPQFA